MIKRLIFGVLVFASSALAEYRPCVDTLAAAQYPEELRHIPNNIAIGGFARTFGKDFFPVAKKELDRGRSFIRVQLIWKDDHRFGKAELKDAIKEAKRYNILCGAYPGRIEVSPFTEHNIGKPDAFLDKVQAAAPKCTIVNNPWPQGGGGFSKKYKSEIHNTHSKVPPGNYNFSYDGENAVDSNIELYKNKYKNADLFCVWHPRLNLKWSMKDSTSRPQRIKEAKIRKPTKKDLESYSYLFTSKGKTKLVKGGLLKSHAERHQAVDHKGDKMLLILPVKAPEVKLMRNNKVVTKLPLYGSFDTGGWRYYASDYGYTYGPDLEVVIGKKNYGVVNGGFRDGFYR